jgi:hypothetical protein
MSDQPAGGFDRSLLLDLSFEERNLDAIQVAISGANNDQPAAGTQPLPGLWQVSLGMARGTKGSDLALTLADATKATGQSESFLAALIESIGNIDKLTPSHSVGDSCGGF